MKHLFQSAILPLLFAGFLFYSCKKERSCNNCQTNKSPIAVAGPDQIITLPTDSIFLDGSASNDPDGWITTWQWRKVAGPSSFTIANTGIEKTQVNNLAEGTYLFELRVTDAGGLFHRDTMQVIVDDPNVNQPPVANAGADIVITLPANTVTLDGSSSADPDNNITNYQWTKISGPVSSTITNASGAIATASSLTAGIYLFELKVTDSGGLFNRDTVQITVFPPTFNGSGVYIAGRSTGNNAALWKNGAAEVLTGVDGTTALSVFVSGNDVYVAGGAYNDWFGFDTTFIWKNGVPQNLDRVELTGVTSVFVSGNDVYAAGWGEYGAVLWKNGQATNLGNEGANAVFVSGSDLYVAGWERKNLGQVQTLVAKYWKNGSAQTLSTSSSISVANSVFEFNGDVYVAGHVGWVATLWKNGVAQNLGNGVANSVFVFNGDVYIAGTSNGHAYLWKNGVAQHLGNGEAKSVYVFNGEVYVVGYKGQSSNGMYTRVATLWKEGVAYTLEGLSEANSVFVQ